MWSYLSNQRSKQTNCMYIEEKNGGKLLKRRTLNMKIYYIIPLNHQSTGHPENFKINLINKINHF